MLNILEGFDLRTRGRWSADSLHLMIEAMRYSFLDRARYLGDPDFVSIPDFLTTKSYAAKVKEKIDLNHAGTSNPADAASPHEEGDETTHFSILDADGMAVSNTYTLEQSYGSHIMVRGRGFLLNNEMGDFNAQPGITTMAGQIGTPANIIAPGKRMLSSMTPIIITHDGKVILITGSPGSRTIINTVLCVVLNRLEFGMSPRECIDAPRISQTWLPDAVALEPALARDHAEAIAALRAMGQPIAPGNAIQGDANSIFVGEDRIHYGVADQRHQGTAASYNFTDPTPRR
jgi:gamma-glutamyltranspeptidase/glutathione hydrolase